MSPLDLTMVFGTILCHGRKDSQAIEMSMVWRHTYLTSFDEVVIPTLMVDAPLSRTMTGARLMMMTGC